MDSRTRVLIAGGVRLYREGIAALLGGSGRVEVVAVTGDCDEALEHAALLAPDVALVDATMSSLHGTVAALAAIKDDMPVVIMGVEGRVQEILAAVDVGARGYVTRDATLEELIAALERAVHGKSTCSPEIAGALFRHVAQLASGAAPVDRAQPWTAASAGLTRRELQIMELVDRGLSNKEIARCLFIEPATVRNHIHNILEKLHVHRRAEAAALLRGIRGVDRLRVPTPEVEQPAAP